MTTTRWPGWVWWLVSGALLVAAGFAVPAAVFYARDRQPLGAVAVVGGWAVVLGVVVVVVGAGWGLARALRGRPGRPRR